MPPIAHALPAWLAAGLLVLSGCSPLDALDRIEPEGGYVRDEGLAYGPHPRQRLDVYRPARAASGRGAPVIVFFYGGGWRSGERQGYRFVCRALARQGYVAVVADYRLYPEAHFPAFVDDTALALRWARDHAGRYGGDPGRLYAMGHSAGAFNAAMAAVAPEYLARVGMKPADLAGVIGLAGPYAFNPLATGRTRPIFAPAAGPGATGAAAGGTANADAESAIASLRPVTALKPGIVLPPMLLLHGRADTTVGPYNTERLAQRVRAAGGRAEEVYLDGVGHIGIVLQLSERFGGGGGSGSGSGDGNGGASRVVAAIVRFVGAP
jgi:acetyl esterase/lipase